MTQLKHTHKERIIKSKYVTGHIISNTLTCKACEVTLKIEDKERARQRLEQAIVLTCDICNIFMGYVYASDLNGNEFYCKNCKESKII